MYKLHYSESIEYRYCFSKEGFKRHLIVMTKLTWNDANSKI